MSHFNNKKQRKLTMKQVTGRNQKVSSVIVSTVKNMVDAGTKDYIIAEAFGVSIATIQNIKRTGYNYGKYRKLVSKQMVNWKMMRDGKSNDKTTLVAKVDNFDRLEEKVDLLISRFAKVFPKVK
jgi:transposase